MRKDENWLKVKMINVLTWPETGSHKQNNDTDLNLGFIQDNLQV